jgi:hypothetical protein
MLTGLSLLIFGTCLGAYTWLQSACAISFPLHRDRHAERAAVPGRFELVLQALVLDAKATPREGSDL